MKRLSLTLLLLGLFVSTAEASPLRALQRNKPVSSRACADFSGTWFPLQNTVPSEGFTFIQYGCEWLTSQQDLMSLRLDATTTMAVAADEASDLIDNQSLIIHAGWDKSRDVLTIDAAQPWLGQSKFDVSKVTL